MKKFVFQQCIFFMLFFVTIFVFSCSKKNSTEPEQKYEIGKNYYTTDIDGDDREYYVHVPTNYNSGIATPVVFMLHGTSGDGEKFYDGSGWKEVGETENILTVFPSSWRYRIIVDGQTGITTKWNSLPAEWTFSPGEIPRDDIKFLRTV